MRTTKKQFIEMITDFLKEHPEKEINVVRYENKLRNGRWGLHAYSICYRFDNVMCRPWSGADKYWNARLERLERDDLEIVLGKCFASTNPKAQ